MFITRSFWRKVVATVGAAVGFVFVYETTMRDSRYAARQAAMADTSAAPRPGAQLRFTATAYCKGETTASGVVVRTGIAAADPTLLPVGTVVRIDTTNEQYDGIWTIMDTGPAVQGRTIDLYLWSCHDALRFGRQTVQLTVLRLGWNPQNSQPGRVDSLFRQREIDRAQMPLPAKPVDPEGTLIAPPPTASDVTVPAAPGPPPPDIF
jgi:3D (Asp-Asp-Asp) domain-containing protein